MILREFFPPEVQQTLHGVALREIATFAAANCPYYERLFDRLGLRPDDLKSIGGARRALQLRGEVLPVLPLAEVLGVPEALPITEGVLVVVENAGRRAALAVDALLGQQQVVVKNLEANFRRVPGLAGATILGSGAVGLILDVEALVQHAGGFGRAAAGETQHDLA